MNIARAVVASNMYIVQCRVKTKKSLHLTKKTSSEDFFWSLYDVVSNQKNYDSLFISILKFWSVAKASLPIFVTLLY